MSPSADRPIGTVDSGVLLVQSACVAAEEDPGDRIDPDRRVKRVVLALLTIPIGWVAGVYLYFGLLTLLGDGPEPGDIHVGALLLGVVGMVGLPLAVWRWSARPRVSNR